MVLKGKNKKSNKIVILLQTTKNTHNSKLCQKINIKTLYTFKEIYFAQY